MLSDNDTMKLYMQNIGRYQLVTEEEEKDLAELIAAGLQKTKDAELENLQAQFIELEKKRDEMKDSGENIRAINKEIKALEKSIEEVSEIIRVGDDARQRLINSNLRLVVKIAHDFKGLGLSLLDLIEEGNIGLMRAVEKFDPSKGAKLSSYAAWWIKQSMRRALANQAKIIRIPVQSASKMGKIQSARNELKEKLNREPTDLEVTNYLNQQASEDGSNTPQITERTVAGLRIGKTTTISLHDPIQQGEDGEFRDIIADDKAMSPDEIVQETETIRYMSDLVKRLEEREQEILTLRFGLNNTKPRTLEDVSQIIGRTRERVRQIQNQALEKLRKIIEEDGFRSSFTNSDY